MAGLAEVLNDKVLNDIEPTVKDPLPYFLCPTTDCGVEIPAPVDGCYRCPRCLAIYGVQYLTGSSRGMRISTQMLAQEFNREAWGSHAVSDRRYQNEFPLEFHAERDLFRST